MSVFLARIVAGEQDLEACDLDQEHSGAKDVAGWVWCYADGGDCVGGVVVDGFNHGKG